MIFQSINSPTLRSIIFEHPDGISITALMGSIDDMYCSESGIPLLIEITFFIIYKNYIKRNVSVFHPKIYDFWNLI